ncbi:hypothetical protein Pfo_016452 [Paulownia fortunei]|nr:hypothetical protein Pfo_016452 [Paulownia fortunei]
MAHSLAIPPSKLGWAFGSFKHNTDSQIPSSPKSHARPNRPSLPSHFLGVGAWLRGVAVLTYIYRRVFQKEINEIEEEQISKKGIIFLDMFSVVSSYIICCISISISSIEPRC